MIRLETFFNVHFDSEEISDTSMRTFAHNHIWRLKGINKTGKYDELVAQSEKAYNDYFTLIADEKSSYALQQGRSIRVNKNIKKFKKEISRRGPLVHALFGINSGEYEEFFPHGKSEYHRANKSNIEPLMKRMAKVAKKYKTRVGQDFVDAFDKLCKDYASARKEQVKQKGKVSKNRVERNEKRYVLACALYYNLLTLAREYMGQPGEMRKFFEQHLIRRHKHWNKEDEQNAQKSK